MLLFDNFSSVLTREGMRADPHCDVENARQLPGIFVPSGTGAVRRSYVSRRIETLELTAFDGFLLTEAQADFGKQRVFAGLPAEAQIRAVGFCKNGTL